MTWGFKNRLNTILPDGRAVMLAIDHGYFLGINSRIRTTT